ncbi:copper amine oxidase N-terminal domain-containing protein [Paenibacillus radicis (ex Xue et al. 2023)]|uniref:Copper amine oxidase N-terminal domain-containing protein n=1 Tax=Paenibacillus radicis (ex Xue et al. 2023) TaxID=2972489 RepID=A0ABT1YAW7_9BACL|nr:copper amine oxidase N-terminal domain-containing protein [Paenibacillus radicis (ex Xue et al. 2023)]MCR8630336.1 copper amine oxidase N-terminal domain-containing protein [Paenibacillus radicis (ex Xue et al. 2023)]
MKKLIIAFVSGIVISLSSVAVAANEFNVTLFPSEFIFNGKTKSVPSEYQVFNYNGQVYVPLRFVTESMGATVGIIASPDYKPNQITIDYKENRDKEFPYSDEDKNISVALTSANQTPRETYITGQVQLNEALYNRNIIGFTIDITLDNETSVPTVHAFAIDIGKDELKSFRVKANGFFDLANISKVEIKSVEMVEYTSE